MKKTAPRMYHIVEFLKGARNHHFLTAGYRMASEELFLLRVGQPFSSGRVSGHLGDPAT